jgi:lycopene cyclase domain-containing protein
MHSEYLLFNLIVISGPFFLSFDRKVAFYKKWPAVFLAILPAFIIFLTWDTLVTGRHWWFNPAFTLDVRFFGLPPGEILFFITVPYSSLFVWEVLAAYFRNKQIPNLYFFRLFLFILLIPGIIFFLARREYTGLVLVVISLVALGDWLLKTDIFLQLRTGQYLMLLTMLMLIFNGYLTARPVVLYNPAYQLNIRIFTIPLEDFFYGYSHIFLTTIVYEKLKGWQNASKSNRHR